MLAVDFTQLDKLLQLSKYMLFFTIARLTLLYSYDDQTACFYPAIGGGRGLWVYHDAQLDALFASR